MTQDEIIEMAKEARIHRDDSWRFEMLQEKNALEAFAKLVAEKATAKERESYFHTIGPNEMALRLVREYNGEFLHYAYKFSANQVMGSLDLPSMVAITAKTISSKIEAAIKARGQA
jgi:hypothetical protein